MVNASLKIVRRRIVSADEERIRRLYDQEEDPLSPANREVLQQLLTAAPG